MGVDYVINLECQPKDDHGIDGLLEMMKARSGVDVIVDQLRRTGNDKPVEELEIVRVVRRPDGDTETKVRVADLLASSAPLEGARPACAGCPADRRTGGFGCFGYINYPISERAEQWLLERLPEDLESPALLLLQMAVRDFDYSGAPSRRMRNAGDTFFDARKPPTRTWGKKKLFRGYDLELTSDQLHHMMFHVGEIEPSHAAMLCAFFGMIPFDAVEDPDALLRPALETPDERSAAQLAQFLLALAFAAANDLTISVSA